MGNGIKMPGGKYIDTTMEKFIDAYMHHLERMLKSHEGKWTVIGRDLKPIGYWDSSEEATKIGSRAYSSRGGFIVRKVSKNYLEHGRYGKSKKDPDKKFRPEVLELLVLKIE